jgi:hypothetical protein
MDAYVEVTEWSDSTPNHTYLMSSDRIFAYIKEGGKKPHYFSAPLTISKRYRKFVKLDVNPFKQDEVADHRIKVTGSKGDVYYVDPVEKTCTCSGFTFRGKCKHLEMAK